MRKQYTQASGNRELLTVKDEEEDIVSSIRKLIAVINGISVANLCEDKWTSAGQKNSYAYQKLIELLELEIISPKTTYVWGCDYRVPMHFGLLDENYIKEIKMSATYKDDTFARELTIPIALIKLFKLLGNAKSQMCYSVV